MIAVVFLAVLLVLALVVGAAGGAAAGPMPVVAIALVLVAFVVFFAAGIYIGAALAVLALVASFAFSSRPMYGFIGQILWIPSTNFVLVAVPLFLLMGEIMLRAGLSERLYRAMSVWLNRLPGGLLHTNILSCSVFSAISGSSVATAATMGSVALPFFERTHYRPRLVLGSLAAGGALGNLIPPGITFIVYGLITETSVGALYVAAVGPSLLVILLFTAVIVLYSRPFAADATPTAEVTPRARLAALADLLPTLLLILLVLGSIYSGLATPTESAALGVVGAVIFAAVERRLTWQMLQDAMTSTARTTSMIGLILFGAYLLNYVLTSLGVPQAMAKFLTALELPPWAMMLLIIGLYLALGTFMEGFSMVITTIPLLFPIVKGLGYDPIWFGVIVTMLVEIAMISPPDGTVLYVLQGLRPRPGPITDIFRGVMPFVAVYIAAIGILMGFPQIALWLPGVLR